jgi:hypothetical protein
MATRKKTGTEATTIKTLIENPETNLEKMIDSLTASALPYYNSIFNNWPVQTLKTHRQFVIS